MTRVFISHSSKDKEIARRISHDLVDLGHQPWLDEWEIGVGDCIQTKVTEGLENCDYLILLLSDNSVTSGWVEKEWKSKYWDEIESKDTLVLTALISDCTIPLLLKTKKYADFRKSYAVGLIEIERTLTPRRKEDARSKRAKGQRRKKDIPIWHHNVHIHIANERLCYCLLTFSPIYCKEQIYAALEKTFTDIGINSFVIYEAAGGIDLILRAWIPAYVSNEEFQQSITLAIQNKTTTRIEYFDWFAVDRVINHWIFSNNIINIEELRAKFKSQRDIDLIYTSEDAFRISSDRGFVAVTEGFEGVTFLVFVTQPQSLNSVQRLEKFRDEIKSIIDSLVGIECISLYSGTVGRFKYLIKGCVRYQDFELINAELLSKLNSPHVQDYLSSRTFTYHSVDNKVVEQLKISNTEEKQRLPTIEELLTKPESENLEVKGYFFGDIDNWVGKTDRELDKNRILEIGAIKSILAFLNSGIEATIVIGAIEVEKYKEFDKTNNLPVINGYGILGLKELEYFRKDKNGWDVFQNKMLQAILANIEPVPSAWLSSRREVFTIGEDQRDLCVISVYRQTEHWFYFKNKPDFFVRDGNRTISLSGRQADEFKAAVRAKR